MAVVATVEDFGTRSRYSSFVFGTILLIVELILRGVLFVKMYEKENTMIPDSTRHTIKHPSTYKDYILCILAYYGSDLVIYEQKKKLIVIGEIITTVSLFITLIIFNIKSNNLIKNDVIKSMNIVSCLCLFGKIIFFYILHYIYCVCDSKNSVGVGVSDGDERKVMGSTIEPLCPEMKSVDLIDDNLIMKNKLRSIELESQQVNEINEESHIEESKGKVEEKSITEKSHLENPLQQYSHKQ